jgi:hypothetical protein
MLDRGPSRRGGGPCSWSSRSWSSAIRPCSPSSRTAGRSPRSRVASGSRVRACTPGSYATRPAASPPSPTARTARRGGETVPSRSAIYRCLKRHHLVKLRRRRRRAARRCPHQDAPRRCPGRGGAGRRRPRRTCRTPQGHSVRARLIRLRVLSRDHDVVTPRGGLRGFIGYLMRVLHSS